MMLKETKGQVLAELLIAGAILAIGLVAALFIITKSIHLMEKANKTQAAVLLASEEMELVKNIQYPYPDDPADSDQYNNITPRTLGGINRLGRSFDLERIVTDTLDAANNQVKKQVEIQIKGHNETNPIVTYTTIFTRNGV